MQIKESNKVSIPASEICSGAIDRLIHVMGLYDPECGAKSPKKGIQQREDILQTRSDCITALNRALQVSIELKEKVVLYRLLKVLKDARFWSHTFPLKSEFIAEVLHEVNTDLINKKVTDITLSYLDCIVL